MKLCQNNHVKSAWCCWKINLIGSKLWGLYYFQFLRVSHFYCFRLYVKLPHTNPNQHITIYFIYLLSALLFCIYFSINMGKSVLLNHNRPKIVGKVVYGFSKANWLEVETSYILHHIFRVVWTFGKAMATNNLKWW